MKKFIVAFIFLCNFNTSFANILGFGDKSWTTEDSRSLCNFMHAQKLMNEATKILNDDSVIIKSPVKKILLDGYNNALNAAKLVEKSTLDKLHPAFFQNYEKYKLGIQARIHSLSQSGTIKQGFTAHELISDFSIWYNTNKKSLKIPKGEVAKCRQNL